MEKLAKIRIDYNYKIKKYFGIKLEDNSFVLIDKNYWDKITANEIWYCEKIREIIDKKGNLIEIYRPIKLSLKDIAKYIRIEYDYKEKVFKIFKSIYGSKELLDKIEPDKIDVKFKVEEFGASNDDYIFIYTIWNDIELEIEKVELRPIDIKYFIKINEEKFPKIVDKFKKYVAKIIKEKFENMNLNIRTNDKKLAKRLFEILKEYGDKIDYTKRIGFPYKIIEPLCITFRSSDGIPFKTIYINELNEKDIELLEKAIEDTLKNGGNICDRYETILVRFNNEKPMIDTNLYSEDYLLS